ncbi:hypothetical protein PIROE2DRAFT_14126, partial [Piromyces sp. E2]
FINCTEAECEEFSRKVDNDEIEEEKIIKTFKYFSNKDDYSREEAIKLIKNVVLIRHRVNYYRTDIITYCYRTILNVAKYVNDYGSSNFNILYALCMTQFNEDESNFRDSARREIIYDIDSRFDCLVNEEIEDAEDLQYTFNELLKVNRRCYHYLY